MWQQGVRHAAAAGAFHKLLAPAGSAGLCRPGSWRPSGGAEEPGPSQPQDSSCLLRGLEEAWVWRLGSS